MIKIGITGGIGSGKTTVCKLFESLNIPIYYADGRAKWLMGNDPQLKKNITELFGEEAYLVDGTLNRVFISTIAFQNQAKLSELNALVHPAVQKDGEIWFSQQKNAPYAIKEAALLIESNSYKQLDEIIVVTAPIEVRVERVMLRDSVKKEAVMARVSKQMSDKDRAQFADYVIDNNGKDLMEQVMKIHGMILG